VSNVTGAHAAIGIDIGGANLKFASPSGIAREVAFPLWQKPDALAAELSRQLQVFPDCSKLLVTMTGELADCYSTKAEGVAHILAAVRQAAAGRETLVWQTSGEFVDNETAEDCWELTAAANWHALATWAARSTGPGECGLLIDAGSTTVDIIPLRDGLPDSQGRTDLTRLLAGELVYTGGRRTPVVAVSQEVEISGHRIPLAAELFATMQDVHLLLGNIVEQPDSCDTADGRPATITNAAQRLARLLCCDRDELGEETLRVIASQIAQHQRERLIESAKRVLQRLPQRPQQLILSGSATFLTHSLCCDIPELSDLKPILLRDRLGQEVASAACAYALTQLCDG